MLSVRDARVVLDGHQALAGVDLDVERGTTVTVLGPSGSGKSTLLRAIAGLQRLDRGSVALDGRSLTGVPPHRRGIGLMFQDDALFPHRDVGENVAFGLRVGGAPRTLTDSRVRELLALVGLAGFERRRVSSLSGGEAQRVALARSLAPEPRALLLDEPLSSLDGPLRERLQADLAGLFAVLGLTVVHVTHDVAEAFALGDAVAVMRDGRIAQTGAPDAVWAHPTDAGVAALLGMDNVTDAGVTRAEAVRARRPIRGDGNATVVSATRIGPSVRLRVLLDDGRELTSVTTALDHPSQGERADVEIDPLGVVAFGATRGLTSR
jgi:thiamine transport system ATP-binding protein